ncbi:MAG TPA: 4Fe-4S double cluster binding domain-containing protein [Thermoleophilia bacterium]|nr:4Fe-4S double cluster binding domain-containing protein [Thermoleophilia bacterium]
MTQDDTTTGLDWPGIVEKLREAGWTAAVVGAERLADVAGRVAGILASGELPGPIAEHLAGETRIEWPAGGAPARSVVVAATARPLTHAVLTVDGRARHVAVPPHYAGYRTVPDRLAAALREALVPYGYAAARFEPPLKTLAACAGLARYGRNNIAYVPGLGSYLMLAACACDAPPPHDAPWGEPLQLERCERCSACLRACPSGAIRADRFLLQTDRCLTCVNEYEAPLPDWVDPGWHHAAVGCLRCQQACPENATVELLVDDPVTFDAEETAAILAGSAALPVETRARMARCGLDYSPALISRNLRVLLGV